MPGHRILQYAEEHPHEVLEVIEDRTDAVVRELEARERAAPPRPSAETAWHEADDDFGAASWSGDDHLPFSG